MEAIVDFFQRNFFVFEIMICYVPYIPLLKSDKNTWWKLLIAAAVLIGYSCLPIARNSGDSQIVSNVLSMLSFLSIFVISLVGIFLSFKSNFWVCILCGISAYLTQHIFFRVRMLTLSLLQEYGVDFEWVNYCYYWGELIAVNIICWFCTARSLQKRGNFKINNKRLLLVALLSVVVVNFLNTVSMSYSFTMPFVPLLSFYLYALLDCVILLYCLYENIYVKTIEDEVKTVQTLWQEDRKRYEIAKNSMDLLNMKIHDLKYRISNRIEDETTLQEVKTAIAECDSLLHTNNEVLDVILSQSKMTCDSKGIGFSCIVDGKLLNAMSAGDLYSLFCNAIDNAVEYLDSVEDAEKKNLSVTVKRHNEMALIQIENFVSDEPKFVDGLPQTTKPDKQNHGFGVKSMKYIVKKYGGYINFSAEDNTFRVEIVLPISC